MPKDYFNVYPFDGELNQIRALFNTLVRLHLIKNWLKNMCGRFNNFNHFVFIAGRG